MSLPTGMESADDLEADSSATGLGDTTDDGRANSAAAQELKSSMSEVEGSIDYVKRMIAQQMEVISKHKASGVDDEVEQKRSEEAAEKRGAEQARKKEEAQKKAERERQHQSRRRQEIDRCLNMIRGGADRLYFSLKKLLAATPLDSVCTVFKSFDFPNLARHGFHEGFYKGEQPNYNGNDALFFKAAKSHLFECMCEYSSSSVAAQAVQGAVKEAKGNVQG